MSEMRVASAVSDFGFDSDPTLRNAVPEVIRRSIVECLAQDDVPTLREIRIGSYSDPYEMVAESEVTLVSARRVERGSNAFALFAFGISLFALLMLTGIYR